MVFLGGGLPLELFVEDLTIFILMVLATFSFSAQVNFQSDEWR